jgi:uncharacterized protein YciI
MMWGPSCFFGRASVMAFLASTSRQAPSHHHLRSTTATSTSAFLKTKVLSLSTTTTSTRMSSSSSSTSTTTGSSLPSKQYVLRYDYIPQVLEKRGPHREKHLGLAKQLIDEGKCFSGGPIGPTGAPVPTGALFLFADLESAQSFVAQDPYVANGIVTAHYIDEWNIVVRKE